MPDVPIKPPNKRVTEIKTALTADMWNGFSIGAKKKIRRKNERTFLISKIADLYAIIEEMQIKIDGLSKG